MTDSGQKDGKLVDERIYLDKQSLLEIEQRIRIERHVERYALLRQFAKGVVCDAACGCGYGSYLLATNPDVSKVIGLDCSSEAIAFARKEYHHDNLAFHEVDLSQWKSTERIDMLISAETIEHVEDRTILPEFVNRNSINHLILTYPSKKTSHYNSFHHHNYKKQDVLDLFEGFTCYRHFNWQWEFDVVFLLRPA
jgi:trans-aconitate methyltransferase